MYLPKKYYLCRLHLLVYQIRFSSHVQPHYCIYILLIIIIIRHSHTLKITCLNLSLSSDFFRSFSGDCRLFSILRCAALVSVVSRVCQISATDVTCSAARNFFIILPTCVSSDGEKDPTRTRLLSVNS